MMLWCQKEWDTKGAAFAVVNSNVALLQTLGKFPKMIQIYVRSGSPTHFQIRIINLPNVQLTQHELAFEDPELEVCSGFDFQNLTFETPTTDTMANDNTPIMNRFYRCRQWRYLLLILFLLFNGRIAVHCHDDPSTKNDASPQRPTTPKWLTKVRRQLQNALRRLPIVKSNTPNDEPEPHIVDNFLTADEAALLLQRYEPLLRESLHFGGAGIVDSKYRTSHSVRLPPLGDELVFDIERRAARLAGMDHAQVEDFQLACYGVDELYGLHRDDDSDPLRRADRSATVLIYLQAPISGGATLFTRRAIEDERDLDTKQRLTTEKGALKLFRKYCARPSKKFVVIEPMVGRAATWPNWYGTNHSQFCRKSTHGACPVTEGKKCVIQQVRGRECDDSSCYSVFGFSCMVLKKVFSICYHW